MLHLLILSPLVRTLADRRSQQPDLKAASQELHWAQQMLSPRAYDVIRREGPCLTRVHAGMQVVPRWERLHQLQWPGAVLTTVTTSASWQGPLRCTPRH